MVRGVEARNENKREMSGVDPANWTTGTGDWGDEKPQQPQQQSQEHHRFQHSDLPPPPVSVRQQPNRFSAVKDFDSPVPPQPPIPTGIKRGSAASASVFGEPTPHIQPSATSIQALRDELLINSVPDQQKHVHHRPISSPTPDRTLEPSSDHQFDNLQHALDQERAAHQSLRTRFEGLLSETHKRLESIKGEFRVKEQTLMEYEEENHMLREQLKEEKEKVAKFKISMKASRGSTTPTNRRKTASAFGFSDIPPAHQHRQF